MTRDPLAEPDRIAFAGDWHANASWSVAAIEHAAEQGADVIVHVGDFGYDFQPRFVRAVVDVLTRMNLTLMFVDGNHDAHPLLARYPVQPNGMRDIADRLRHIPRGFRWQWAGRTWLGCGGAHSVDRQWRVPGLSWWPEETITFADVDRCVEGGPADVLISHDCPLGIDIPGLLPPGTFPPEAIAAAEVHRDLLRTVVDDCRPKLIVHGHYHSAYRTEVDLGYGRVSVRGLDMDGTSFDRNLWIAGLDEIKELTA